MYNILTYIGTANDIVMLTSDECSVINIDLPIYNYEEIDSNTSYIFRIRNMIERNV